MEIGDLILEDVKPVKEKRERIPSYAIIDKPLDDTAEAYLKALYDKRKKNSKWTRNQETAYLNRRADECGWKLIEPITTKIALPRFHTLGERFGYRGKYRETRFHDLNRYERPEMERLSFERLRRGVAVLYKDVFYRQEGSKQTGESLYEEDGVIFKSHAFLYAMKVYNNIRNTFDAFQYLESIREYLEATFNGPNVNYKQDLMEYIIHLEKEIGFDVEEGDMWSDILTRNLSESTMRKVVREDDKEMVIEHGNITIKYAK